MEVRDQKRVLGFRVSLGFWGLSLASRASEWEGFGVAGSIVLTGVCMRARAPGQGRGQDGGQEVDCHLREALPGSGVPCSFVIVLVRTVNQSE